MDSWFIPSNLRRTRRCTKGNQTDSEPKRILGIVPNYRTSPSLTNYEPISAKEKFVIASQDSFDRGTVILGAAFAGEGQLTDANRPFGQGAAGYGRYVGTSYADHRQLHDASDLSNYPAPGPALFSAWHGEPAVKAVIRDP